MHKPSDHSQLPIEMLGILSFVSDGVIVYKDYEILYSNPEGYLLLEQTSHTLLENLQFDSQEKSLHISHMLIPERNERFVANCLGIQWQNTEANIAIIKPEKEYEQILGSSQDTDIQAHVLNTRNRLDALFNSAGDGYWDWYIPTSDVYFSTGWKQMLGYEDKEISPSFNSWVKLIHPDDLGNFLLLWTDYMENSETHFSIEYRVLCKNGKYLWMEAHGIKELNSANEVIRISGFHRDISTRKKNEIKILEYQENLEQLVIQRTSELEHANKNAR